MWARFFWFFYFDFDFLCMFRGLNPRNGAWRAINRWRAVHPQKCQWFGYMSVIFFFFFFFFACFVRQLLGPTFGPLEVIRQPFSLKNTATIRLQNGSKKNSSHTNTRQKLQVTHTNTRHANNGQSGFNRVRVNPRSFAGHLLWKNEHGNDSVIWARFPERLTLIPIYIYIYI